MKAIQKFLSHIFIDGLSGMGWTFFDADHRDDLKTGR